MSAPKRLLEDPETAAALRADLEAIASHQVNFDLSAGLARFEASLAAGSAAAAASVKPALTLLKLGMAGVVAGGAVLGVALLSGNDASPIVAPSQTLSVPVTPSVTPMTPRAPQPSAPSVATPTLSAAPGTATPDAADSAAIVARQPAGATARSSRKATPAPLGSTAESRDDLLQREVQQLRQIRQLVGANPSQALALANEGHGTFKGGVLYQEREALALQALSALGRRSELEARGERYLRAFPNSSFSSRVRQLMGR
jgi:hypothetical protein